MNRRVQILRFWLLTAAAIALTHLWPGLALYLFASFAWVPLGLFMPVFAGYACGTVTAACTGISGPSQVTVTISGLAGSACSGGTTLCSSFDGTYVCTFLSEDSDSCNYLVALPANDCPNWDVVRAFIIYSASNTTLKVQMQPLIGYWEDTTTLGASPIDCSAIGTVSLPVGSAAGDCSLTGTTCEFEV